MNVLVRVLYVLAFISVLVFISDCDCQKKPNPKKAVVTCMDGEPVLTDGVHTLSRSSTSLGFDQSKYDCPKPTGSPIWRGSGKPIYPSATHSPKPMERRFAGATPRAFLAPTILDLPFLPLSWSSLSDDVPCDPSFPDVLQVHHTNALVTRFSTCPFRVITTIPVATRPLQIDITPDGQTALVTSFDNVVNFIDLATNKVTYTLNTGTLNPHGIAITADGTRAYITSFNNMNPVVATIDLATRTITGAINVAPFPQSVYITPDGAQLYVTFPLGNAVYIIDLLTNTIANTFSIPTPRDIAFNSKGSKAYITSASGSPGTVQELNMNTFQIDKIYNVGLGPTDVAVFYGDQEVMVNNYEGQSISIIDTVTGLVTTTPMSGSPIGMSIVR